MIYLTKTSCHNVHLNMHSWKWSNSENGSEEREKNIANHALIYSRKSDEMLDKTSNLTIFSNTFKKLRNTEVSYKILPFSNI